MHDLKYGVAEHRTQPERIKASHATNARDLRRKQKQINLLVIENSPNLFEHIGCLHVGDNKGQTLTAHRFPV